MHHKIAAIILGLISLVTIIWGILFFLDVPYKNKTIYAMIPHDEGGGLAMAIFTMAGFIAAIPILIASLGIYFGKKWGYGLFFLTIFGLIIAYIRG